MWIIVNVSNQFNLNKIYEIGNYTLSDTRPGKKQKPI